MTSTTLHTFLPWIPQAYSVHILGSWDNFATPYPLEKDRQKGHGHWTGCHSFKNIVCDGDPSQSIRKRNGALRMGGTYWYYYLLDGDVEWVDPTLPITSRCPLFPGQNVNILQISSDIQDYSPAELVKNGWKAFTLDPKARFKNVAQQPSRKRPVSSTIFPFKSDAPLTSLSRRATIGVEGLYNNLNTRDRLSSQMPHKHISQTTTPDRDPLHSHIAPRSNLLGHAFMPRSSTPDQRPETRHGEPTAGQSYILSNSTRHNSVSSKTLPSLMGHIHPEMAQIQPPLSHTITHRSNASLSANIEHESKQNFLFPPAETPPLLSMTMSPDASPLSILTPSAPRLRHELRKLQDSENQEPLPWNHEALAYLRPRLPADSASLMTSGLKSTYINPMRLGSPSMANNTMTLHQSIGEPDLQPANAEMNHRRGYNTPYDTFDNEQVMPLTPQAFNFDHAPDNRSNSFTFKDDTLEDLTYLGSFIV